jgi:hypothetical protein
MKSLKREEGNVAFSYLALAVFVFIFIVIFSSGVLAAGTPQPPNTFNVTLNETRGLTPQAGYMLNTSGGYITTINLTARVQNTRWKAFVGWITGKFALDSASGSTIYDWTSATTQGNIYATRNSSIIAWSNIACATGGQINTEDALLNHSTSYDNVTATFSDQTHNAFSVGAVSIPANTCKGKNTYIANATQDSFFQEVLLSDSASIVYTTIIESGGHVGFDGISYDFQMIVPENGGRTWTSSTAYYLYVELV